VAGNDAASFYDSPLLRALALRCPLLLPRSPPENDADYPQAHEDDAERAVRAGLELVAAVGALKTHAALQTRVGIATGADGHLVTI
jgi:hypothetical protein